MIFGVSRHQYEAPARFKVGGPVQRIRYYFAPAGATVYLEPNAFFPIEQTLQYTPTDGVGELCTEPRKNDKRKKPAGVDGQMVHGTLEDFQGLTPYTGPVPIADVPDCRVPKLIRFFCTGPSKRLLSSTFALHASATKSPPRPRLTMRCTRSPLSKPVASLAMKAAIVGPLFPAKGALVLSGSVAPADGRWLFGAPAIPTGRLLFTQPNKAEPASSCAAAAFLTLGIEYTVKTNLTPTGFIKWPVTSGVGYRLTFAFDPAGPATPALLTGEISCSPNSFSHYLNSTDTEFVFKADSGDDMVLLAIVGTSPTVYSFTIKLEEEDDTMTGQISMYGAATPPAGWLACDGSAVSRTTFADLFAVIGTTWGVGDGTTTFNLPDLRGRAPIGQGTGSGLTARTIAGSGGEETHVLSEAELASHNHTTTAKSRPAFNLSGASRVDVFNVGSPDLTSPYDTDNAGSDTPHNNMQPYKVVAFIIKT